MRTFVVAVAIAFIGTSMLAGDASARSKRGTGAAGMAGIAAMAPVALSAVPALIGSGCCVGGQAVTPDVHMPVYSPIYVPTPIGVPSYSSENIGG